MTFISKQFIDVIHWTEPQDGVLAFRFPMEDMEIQSGAKLTVRQSQIAIFVNEGVIADVFEPGLYTLTTHTLPLLTNLKNWDKLFQSPFKSDVYFFSTRLQIDQKWGTSNPVTFRDKEFGAVRVRGHGIYSYRISDVRAFYLNVSGTVSEYRVDSLEGQLRNTIIELVADTFAESSVPFLELAANQVVLAGRVLDRAKPVFARLGLDLDSFVVESISLPEELQRRLDERIGMAMVGDLNKYTQFQVAQSLPVAAANEGSGGAGLGAGLGVGMAMAQAITNAVRPTSNESAGKTAGISSESKFCIDCGKSIPLRAKYCPECGHSQQ